LAFVLPAGRAGGRAAFRDILVNSFLVRRVHIVVTATDIAIEEEEQRAVAIQIAVDVGLLKRCQKHGSVYDAMDDFALADAERYAATLMAENDPTVAVFQGNRRRMKRVIDEVRTGMPNCCAECFYSRAKS
jgi:hypothetical protein